MSFKEPPQEEEHEKKRGRYNAITDVMRRELIESVVRESLSIKQASSRLKIKYSTAKSILHIYKETGRTSRDNKLRRTPRHRRLKVKEEAIASEIVVKFLEGDSEPAPGQDLTYASVKMEEDKNQDRPNVQLKKQRVFPTNKRGEALYQHFKN
eukprot:TRINITY_DN15263_c0_g1_i1.p1 TRINITY_DN15263_c0_g1~~TRINITY_DN15263_c0_g1_i1.p1  ORF type:complete len:153 (+),score=11.04 TRINITY_DN15263_c0_g1_i1:3-461(+)